MKTKKGYLLMWYSSLLFLIVSLLFFALFLLYRWSRPVLGVCAVVFAIIFVALYLLCREPLKCEDGYSLPQAITYYRNCTKAGCATNTLKKNEQILLQQAAKEGLDDYDFEQLQKCFKVGARAVREIQNPILQAIWQAKKLKEKK